MPYVVFGSFCNRPICKNCLIVPRYEKSSRFMKEGYERDFLRYLQSLLAEVERRIRRGHARLALSQAQQSAGVCKLIGNLGPSVVVFLPVSYRDSSDGEFGVLEPNKVGIDRFCIFRLLVHLGRMKKRPKS